MKTLNSLFIIIVMIILLFLCPSCRNKDHLFYYNRTGTIVSINNNENSMQRIYSGKTCTTFPVMIGSVLIRDDTDPELHILLTTEDVYKYHHDSTEHHIDLIDTAWIYNHKPGDKVYFKYILKDRYFKIIKRK